MTVTKVVGFDLRIPKHFILHFSDFSTILYGIYKFAVFENKRKRKRTFASWPLELCFLLTRGPWSDQEQRRVGAAFPGEERLRRRGIGGGGARGGRRAPAGVLGSRRGGQRRHLHEHQWPAAMGLVGSGTPAARGGGLGPMSFTGIRGSRSRAPLRQKKAGGGSSTGSGRPAGLCAAATACRRRLRGADGFGRVTGRRWSCWGTRFGEREGDGAGRRGGRGRRRPWLTASVACEQSSARVR